MHKLKSLDPVAPFNIGDMVKVRSSGEYDYIAAYATVPYGMLTDAKGQNRPALHRGYKLKLTGSIALHSALELIERAGA